MTEAEFYNLSDEEAEAAFRAAKAELNSPDVEQDLDSTVTSQDDTTVEIDNVSEQATEPSDHNSTDEEQVGTEEQGSKEDTQVTDEQQVPQNVQQQVQKLKVKASGMEYEFTPDEIMQNFPKVFGQAMDYTKKMQAIKPWRKTIDAIEQAQLKHDDIGLMIDALKGDKDAIGELLKRTGVDSLDLDPQNAKYTPKNYGRDDKTLAIKEVVDEIYQDKEYATTQSILSQKWDEQSWNKMTEDPTMIKLLHEDVKSGMFDRLQPRINKMKMMNPIQGASDLDYYGIAAREFYNELAQMNQLAQQQQMVQQQQRMPAPAQQPVVDPRVQQVKQQEAARNANQQASAKRKAAATTNSMAGSGKSVTDYLNASDEQFDDWYERTMGYKP